MRRKEEVADASRPEQAGRPAISRRTLLAGSAGLTLGSIALPGTAGAQHGTDQVQTAAVGGHGGGPVGSLSQRAYSVPTPAANDIAHDPSVVPPPITRSTPETLQLNLETVEARTNYT